MTQLILIRHAESTANLLGVVDGGDGMNARLTDNGHDQAEKVGRYISSEFPNAVALYASPLNRTVETATHIAKATGLPVLTEEGLTEGKIGSWNGRPIDHPEWNLLRDNPDYDEHGGESPRRLGSRAGQTFIRLVEAHQFQQVLVVSHGATIRHGLAMIMQSPMVTGEIYPISNTGITALDFQGLPKFTRKNDTTHLGSS